MVRRLRQRLDILEHRHLFYIDETVRLEKTRLNQRSQPFVKEDKRECLLGILELTLVLPMY